ncbi:MAG TPA: ECF-type sigma factor [Bryobacteraceae bacterium]|nr:ECF-type sigma factor [Bryobacteraceae bacterium]
MSSAGPKFIDRVRAGDLSALNELTPALYDELRRIAARHLRGERHDHTLQPTALVNEAYLKLFDGAERRGFNGEVHFLAVASRVMRQVLVDHARARSAQKRGAGMDIDLRWNGQAEPDPHSDMEPVELIQLDTALQALAEEDESLARVIEMRYFGGMTAEETAEALGISVHVVRHDLRFAQAWLRRRLKG